MEAKVGIKEMMELLNGLQVLAVDGKKLVDNGKDIMADLAILLGILGQFKVLSAAIQGCDKIPAEAKDLDAEEINMIISKVLEIAAAVKAA